VINGNDPVETYIQMKDLMNYVRTKRKPVLVEAMVSRLYGHSSASGANLIPEDDPVRMFETKLLNQGVVTEAEVKEVWARFEAEGRQAQEQVRQEPGPAPESVWDHVYANNENADWRKF
jgi:2-oxoisovalerate dehydrogenase E1 component alpha subunit